MPDEPRFEFGANWTKFLESVDDDRISAAVGSLQQMLGVELLKGKRFLDVGSGSGLFSLAAHRLGADVHSFDFDSQSVACTEEIKRRFAPDAPNWTVEQGSALDAEYLETVGSADVVYSWGVLHHTGEMWKGVGLVADRVKPGGRLWLAIYNDQGPITARWVRVKRSYQQLPDVLRPLLCLSVGAVLFVHRLGRTVASSLIELLTCGNPSAPFRRLSGTIRQPDPRGMNRWHDLVDWVGGWPFEVAKPEEVIDFLQQRGFALQRLKTVGGNMGCNEFVFERTKESPPYSPSSET